MSKALSNAMKVSALALSLFAGFANADVGGFKLQGTVMDTTCIVTVNGVDATDPGQSMFSLGSLTAASAASAAVGELVGDQMATAITIAVSDCSSQSDPKAITFSQGVNGAVVNGKSGYKNTVVNGGSTGVNAAITAVQSGSTDFVPVDFGTPIDLTQTSDALDPDVPYAGELRVKAQFMKVNDSVTSGTFETMATFDIVYI